MSERDNMTEARRFLGNARGMIERISRFDPDEMAANPTRVQRLAAAALSELDAGRSALARLAQKGGEQVSDEEDFAIHIADMVTTWKVDRAVLVVKARDEQVSAETVARIVARLRKTLPLQYGYVIEDIEREFKP